MNNSKYLWHPQTSRLENVYVMFQAELAVEHSASYTLNMFGSNAYRAYLDGVEYMQGPARFDANHPEYDVSTLELATGSHVLSIIVHYFGISTRFVAPETPAFWQFACTGPSGLIDVTWKCKELGAFAHLKRRTNEQLGWMEVCDQRLLPELAQIHQGEDWVDPVEVEVQLGLGKPKTIDDCHTIPVPAIPMGSGSYANRFGYLDDDQPVRFMLRDLAPTLPAEGGWLRFDLGQIGLYCPQITIDAPAGTLVEAGYCEYLMKDRVHPVITLSASNSANMDRWITKAGEQTIQTFSPRGFRYLEVHIADPTVSLDSVHVTGLQRSYFTQPVGSFRCSDDLLNEIWQLGVNTLQACSEDALTDTPTRERGQWLGDAVAVGLESLSVSFGDLSLIRRGLMQAAYCRSEEGLVSGLYPGQNAYLSSFSLLWVSGCVRYYWKTGDLELLREVHDTAVKTMDIFMAELTPKGIAKFAGWNFVDWGHAVPEDSINVALNFMTLASLRDLAVWERELGNEDAALHREKQAESLEKLILANYLRPDGSLAQWIPSAGELDSSSYVPGYHATALAVGLRILNGEQRNIAIQFVKNHILSCFPNDESAPRLSHPEANNNRLITPYFLHFVLQALWEAGEVDFVLDQYRVCWGWMVDQKTTTLLEVFDPRWSHCHAWAAAPTWQLSAHVLGVMPNRSGDRYAFDWFPKPGELTSAEGKLPIEQGNALLQINWQKSADNWIYELATEVPIKLNLTDSLHYHSIAIDGIEHSAASGQIQINHTLKISFS